jgi:hypothetical protein
MFARLRDAQLFLRWFEVAATDPEEEARAALPAQIIALDVDAHAVFTKVIADDAERVQFAVVDALGEYRDSESAKETITAAIRERPAIRGRAVPTLKRLNLNVGEVVVAFVCGAKN